MIRRRYRSPSSYGTDGNRYAIDCYQDEIEDAEPEADDEDYPRRLTAREARYMHGEGI